MTDKNEKIAELCGAITGDGWICSTEKSFFLAGDMSEDKDYYDDNIAKIVNEIFNIKILPKKYPYWKVYGIGVHKKNLVKKLLNYGLKKGKKVDTAFVPEWILSNRIYFFNFMRGLFDTDGSVFCQKDYTKYASDYNSQYHVNIRLRIVSISSVLINQIYNKLNEYNFKCSKRVLKRGFKFNRNNHDAYVLELNSNWVKEFFRKIKPSNPKHTTKYQIWEKFGFLPPKTTLLQRKEIIKNKLSPYKFY